MWSAIVSAVSFLKLFSLMYKWLGVSSCVSMVTSICTHYISKRTQKINSERINLVSCSTRQTISSAWEMNEKRSPLVEYDILLVKWNIFFCYLRLTHWVLKYQKLKSLEWFLKLYSAVSKRHCSVYKWSTHTPHILVQKMYIIFTLCNAEMSRARQSS